MSKDNLERIAVDTLRGRVETLDDKQLTLSKSFGDLLERIVALESLTARQESDMRLLRSQVLTTTPPAASEERCAYPDCDYYPGQIHPDGDELYGEFSKHYHPFTPAPSPPATEVKERLRWLDERQPVVPLGEPAPRSAAPKECGCGCHQYPYKGTKPVCACCAQSVAPWWESALSKQEAELVLLRTRAASDAAEVKRLRAFEEAYQRMQTLLEQECHENTISWNAVSNALHRPERGAK